ncbi:hypothetical protein CGRA01v4_05718 [Colletotrichum graminicola]|nr:hypothetical protein CGRA01v4_05718 [Colletotrichum graminicola]
MAASFFFLFFFSFSSSPATLVSERLWRPAAQQHPKFLKHYPYVGAERRSAWRNNPSRRPISPRSARHPGLRTLNTQQARRDDDETGAVQNKHSATSP